MTHFREPLEVLEVLETYIIKSSFHLGAGEIDFPVVKEELPALTNTCTVVWTLGSAGGYGENQYSGG